MLGKIAGAIIGFFMGGFWGLLIGLFLGHQVDRRLPGWLLGALKKSVMQHQERVQKVFFESTFLVMGHLAKADGRVSEAEIELARQVMRRMNLSEAATREAMELFGRGKAPEFDLDQTLGSLRQIALSHRNLAQMFIEIQLSAAYADGALAGPERAILLKVCQALGFTEEDFNRLDAMIQAELHGRHGGGRAAGPSLADAYAILNVDEKASNAEVKTAYRRLMNQHHPDKLQAKGLPKEMMKLAQEKTQEIRAAYERIREVRGFK